MEPIEKHTGLVCPLNRANIDTDQIIPKQFLKRIERSGFGQFLFYHWRFDDDGNKRPDFPLNDSKYKDATILLAGDNFGCGSSREHAPWSLLDYGFRVIIAPSFADIFYNNSLKNGLLPIVLPEAQVDRLFSEVAAFPGFRLVVDLPEQVVRTEDGSFSCRFEVDPHRKYCLVNGLDDIGLSLQHADLIREYETRRLREKPWLARTLAR